MVIAVAPGLVRVTVWAGVDEPTASSPKDSAVGDRVGGVITLVPPVLPTSCSTVGLPGWSVGMVRVPVVIPDAGAVKLTSTWHQFPLSDGEVASRLLPQGCEGSLVTVKPLLAEIVPSVAAALPEFMTVIFCAGVAVPTAACSKVVVDG